MKTATDHAKTVLSAIIPARKDFLGDALRRLRPGHFTDVYYSNLFKMLERYLDATGAVLTRDALEDLLSASGADQGKVLQYTELWDLFASIEVEEASFRWALEQLEHLAAERTTGEILAQGMEILTQGASSPKGDKLYGHADARAHVLTSFSAVDQELHQQDAPEGDVRGELQEILAEYARRKKLRMSGNSLGILTGIPEMDERLGGGLQSGELDLIAGYTSAGKSSFCVQLAWHCAVIQGLNVVYFTTETLRPQIRVKLIARHSRLLAPEGLNSSDIKSATLSDEGEQKLQEVLADFTGNQAYGRCYVAQIPRGGTLTALESRAMRISRQFKVDLLVIDSLNLLRADRKRTSDREELGGILREAKNFAATFDDGAGVPIVSPWQVNRTSKLEADRVGFYTTAALAETAEASTTPDVIFSLLEPPGGAENRYCTVKASLLKNRDGERLTSMDLSVDYATSSFSAKEHEGAMMEDLLGSSGGGVFG